MNQHTSQTTLHRAGALLALLLSVFSFCSCVGPHDAISKKSLTDLKAYHIKFFDTVTVNSEPPYSTKEVQKWRQDGDLLFRQAEAHSETLKDDMRTKNFIYLHEEFSNDTAMVLERQRPLSAVFAGELKKETARGYDWAIKGEDARRKSGE